MKVLMVSEYSDPCFHIGTTIQRLRNQLYKDQRCVIIISKELDKCEPIIKYCKDSDITFILHMTMTGLGGSIIEPNVPNMYIMMERMGKFFDDNKVDPISTVVRIDPIVPFYSDFDKIRDILDFANGCGITQCRISIMDYYNHVQERFRAADLKYHRDFQICDADKDRIILGVLDETMKRDMMLYLCAERLPNNIRPDLVGAWISNRGCASINEWSTLGHKVDLFDRRQRGMCTCDAKKQDILYGIEKGCPHQCIYCYFKW